MIEEVSQSLAARDRSWLTDARHYDESSVGRLMTQDVVAVRDTQTVAEVLGELRARREIPDQTDRLFAIDTRQIVRGAVPLHLLVRSDPATIISDMMVVDVPSFTPGARRRRPPRRSRNTTSSRLRWWTIAASCSAGSPSTE